MKSQLFFNKLNYNNYITKCYSELSLFNDANDNLWIASNDLIKNYIEIYLKVSDNILLIKKYELSSEMNSAKVCFFKNGEKLFICVVAAKKIQMFLYINNKWSDEPCEEYNIDIGDIQKKDSININCIDETVFLTVNKIKSSYLVDIKNNNKIMCFDNNVDKNIIFNNFHNQEFYYAKYNEKSVIIYKYDYIAQFCSDIIEYSNVKCKMIYFDNYDIYSVLGLYDEKNMKFYFCENNKWEKKYRFLLKISDSFKKIILKYDLTGKLWMFVLDKNNKLNIYDFINDIYEIRLVHSLQYECKFEFDVIMKNTGGFDIICENLLEKQITIPHSEIGKFLLLAENTIQNSHEENFEYSDLFDIDIELFNLKSSYELDFGEYYKNCIISLKEFIDDNNAKIKNCERRNNCKVNVDEIIKNIFKKKKLFEAKIEIYSLKNNIYTLKNNNLTNNATGKIYKINNLKITDEILRMFYIVDTNAYSLILRNNKIILLEWENNGKILNFDFKINTSLINICDKNIHIYYLNNEYELLNNECFNLCLNTINYSMYKYNLNYNNMMCNFSLQEVNNKNYNCNFVTFGYVSKNDMRGFPRYYDSFNFSDEKIFTMRYNNNNFFTKERIFSRLKIIRFVVNIIPKNNSFDDLFQMLIDKSLKDLMKKCFVSKLFSYDENNNEIQWFSDNNDDNLYFNFDELNNIYCNKTDYDIDINIKSSIYFGENNFFIESNTMLYGVLCENKNIFIKSEYIENDVSENNIFEIVSSNI
jgi:hypothetical protein